jgi:hypothetical protein
LYFEKRDYEVIALVLEKVYQQMREHSQPKVPLFTKQLAPGLGLAEEPNHKFTDREMSKIFNKIY